jgi:hypothetical protein
MTEVVTKYTNDEGDRFHRANGPAITWQYGDWAWYLNGKDHRYYGPANTYQEWWIHGVFYGIS